MLPYHRHIIFFVALLVVSLVGQPAAPPAPVQQIEHDHFVHLPLVIQPPAHHPYVNAVIERTNYYRQQHGCPPLTRDDRLHDAAQRHSDDMAENDFFAHEGSDGSSPSDRLRDAGYDWVGAAENIAAGISSPSAVVDKWMESDQGHRDNILTCAFEQIGVGYRYLSNDTGSTNYHHYWTQVFGTPR